MNVWGGNESIYYSYSMMLPLNYCFQRDVMVFLLLRILVEWLNSADRPNESRGYMYTADCTCHHLTKNVYFLSEIWNLNKSRTEKFANVAPFVCLNAVFLSWAKNTTTWLYVTLTGHITIRHILDKIQSLRSEHKRMVLVIDDFASKLLFPSWCYDFFCWKESWSNELIQPNKLTSCWHVRLIVHVTMWLKMCIFKAKYEI